jgi:CheY-like chemotaxis protein
MKSRTIPKKNILLVDDEASFLMSMADGLKSIYGRQCNIFTAQNGRIAVEMLKTVVVDTVVTDLRMPEMDGFESARRILEHNKQYIIVAFTADNMPDTKRKAELSGIREFISKPVRLEELKKLFAKYFNK